MRIKLIAEGHSKIDRLHLKWGLSFLIGKTILFDAFGREDLFIKNVRKFKVSINSLKYIIISHDDWDHIAAIKRILSRNKNVIVYICKDSSQQLKNTIKQNGGRYLEVFKPCLIDKGVYSTGQIKADTNRGEIYEQSLIVEDKDGLCLITGCAHPGIENIVEFANRYMKKPIKTIIGGFHLKDNSSEMNDMVICRLWELGVKNVVPLHCTGRKATSMLRDIYKNNFLRLPVGNTLDI